MNVMTSLRTVYLAPDDVNRIVMPLLKEGFGTYGFRGQTVEEDETFSGDPIIRVRAEVDRPVPASELVSVLGRIHAALRARNDERFVFLSAPGPARAQPEGDQDEDLI